MQCNHLVSIKSSSLGVIVGADIPSWLPVSLSLQELLGLVVPPTFHFVQFKLFPFIHCNWPAKDDTVKNKGQHEYSDFDIKSPVLFSPILQPDKGEMNSQSPMFSAALEANPNPIRDRYPLRIVSTTLKTFLTKNWMSHSILFVYEKFPSMVTFTESLRGEKSLSLHYFHLLAVAQQALSWSEG